MLPPRIFDPMPKLEPATTEFGCLHEILANQTDRQTEIRKGKVEGAVAN